MRILILSTKMPWPPHDGGSIATLNLARGLARMQNEVTLLTMNTPKHYFPPGKVPSNIRSGLNLQTVDVDTRIRPFKLIFNLLFSRYPYNAARFVSTPFRQKLRQCLDESDFDIIQLEGPYLYPYLAEIPGRCKISLRAHNLEHQLWQSTGKPGRNPLKKAYFHLLHHRIKRLENRVLKSIDMLVPISEGDAAIFRQMNPELPMQVVGGGLDLERYTEKPLPGKTALCFLGALDWEPNQEGLDWFFKQIWPEIRSEWPEITLHLAGRNPSFYFGTRSLPEGVFLQGEVKDAVEFLGACSVMIVPLLTGSGIRIKILEAMAIGRVVISTTVGVEGLNVEHQKQVFIADQAAGFMDAIREVKDNPGKAPEMARSARQFVRENFDNLALSEQLSHFYQAQLK